MELKFSVDKQLLKRQDNQKIVADSKDYISLGFAFSSDWDETAKTAVIKQNGITYNVPIENDIAPSRIMPILRVGELELSIFGGTGSKLITTNSILMSVIESGFEEGDIPPEPPVDVYNEILNIAQGAKEQANNADIKVDDLIDRANKGEFNGKDGKDGEGIAYTFEIRDGELAMIYNDTVKDIPDMSIDIDGFLVLKIKE